MTEKPLYLFNLQRRSQTKFQFFIAFIAPVLAMIGVATWDLETFFICLSANLIVIIMIWEQFLRVHYEYIRLDKNGLSYYYPFRIFQKNWQLPWQDIRLIKSTDIRLSAKKYRTLLTLCSNNHPIRTLIPNEWITKSYPQEQRDNTDWKTSEFAQYINKYHLLDHAKKETHLSIPTSFEIERSKAFSWVLILTLFMMIYGVYDLFHNPESYLNSPPHFIYLFLAILTFYLLHQYFQQQKLPKEESLFIALLFSFIFFLVSYLFGLRANQFLDQNKLQGYPYTRQSNLTFNPQNPLLPVIALHQYDFYWRTLKPNSEYIFYLRKGGLGFYQFDRGKILQDVKIYNKQKEKWHDEIQKEAKAAKSFVPPAPD